MRVGARWLFTACAALFVVGVGVQVYLVGLAVVAGRIGFASHVALGHALALPLLLMLVAVHVGRMPRQTVLLAWLLFGVYVLQAYVLIFMRATAPWLAALHPVLALVDVILGVLLVARGWAAVRSAASPAEGRRLLAEPS